MRFSRLYSWVGLLLTAGFGLAQPISPELGHANFHTLSADFVPEGTIIRQIDQLADGRMIWGANDRLLIQDGSEVESILLPEDPGQIRSIAGTPDGRILISSSNYAGVAHFNPALGWQLQGWMPVRQKVLPFKDNATLVERDGALIVLNNNDGAWLDGRQWHRWPHLDSIPNQSPVNAYWLTNRSVYRLRDARTLDRWVSGSWQFDRKLKQDAPEYIGTPHETPARDLLLVQPKDGLMTITGRGDMLGQAAPGPDRVGDDWVAWFANGSAVVRSQDSSIRIQDARGRETARADESNGLRVGDMRDLFVDRSNRFWAALGDSVVFMNLPEHLTRFDRTNGLETTEVLALTRYQGRLYAGTNGGVYQLIPRSPLDARGAARFERVPGINSRTSSLLVHDGQLFAGHAEGVSQLGPDSFVMVSHTNSQVTTLVASPFDPDRIYMGTAGGARSLRRTAHDWVPGETRAFLRSITAILEFAPNAWLINSGSHDLQRFQASFQHVDAPPPTSNDDRIKLTSMGIPLFGNSYVPEAQLLTGAAGFPLNRLSLAQWGDTPLIVSEEGLFSTEAEPQALPLFDPDTQRALTQDRRLRIFTPSAPTRAWLALTPRREAARQGLGWQIREVTRNGTEPLRILPHATTEVGDIRTLFSETAPDGEEILWVGGTHGLLRVRLDGLPAPSFPLPPRLHSNPALVSQGEALSMPEGQDGITFQFASPEHITTPLFYRSRLRLNGVGDWTSFEPNSRREFNFPGWGDYVFEVQARNSAGRLSEIRTLSFTVPPPWWLRPWAIALGVLAMLGGFVAILRGRSAQLQHRQRQLEAIVDERTADLRANEQELTLEKTRADTARAQAEQANRAKSTFLAAMSHELRTPLNAILGFAQILRREDGLSPKGLTQLGVIDRNGQHLLGMINEVLDLSKIEAGRMGLHPAAFSLRRLASDLAETFQLRASQRGLNFRLELGAGVPPRVIADESKLRQVLINLLANAIEHTSSGEVVLALSCQGDRVRFGIHDTGKGIAAAELETIFEPFRQTQIDDTIAAVESRGSGLGLPISRRLVHLMGGTIGVESEIGRGSCFHFELNLPPAPESSDSAIPFRITGYAGPRRRILVVDDVETNRTVLNDLLTILGFEVVEADTGEAAIKSHQETPADLVLLDLHLPDITGREVARILSASEPRPRLIAVSASVLNFDQTSAIRSGCDAFVPKPIEENVLLKSIAEQLHLKWTTTPLPKRRDATLEDTPSRYATEDILALELPAHTELVAWLELARSADLRTLRDQLAAADPASPGQSFRHEIDLLAKRFRTGTIREILTQALHRQNPAAPES